MSYFYVTLLLTLAPNILLFIFIYGKDEHPEPKSLIMRMALHGAAVGAGGAIMWATAFRSLFPAPVDPVWGAAYKAFLLASIPEEFFKMWAIYMVAYRHPAFDEPFDGIVYGATSSLGFATLENLLYVSQGGIWTAAVRSVSAIPLHAFLGVIMGYHIGRAKFAVSSFSRTWHRTSAYVVPMMLHGIYDWGVMASPAIGQQGYLISGFVLVFTIGYGNSLITHMKQRNLYYLSEYLRIPERVLKSLLHSGQASEEVMLRYLEARRQESESPEPHHETLHEVATRKPHPRGLLGLIYIYGGILLFTLGLMILVGALSGGVEVQGHGRQVRYEAMWITSALGIFAQINGLLLFIKGLVRGRVPTRPWFARAMITLAYVLVTLFLLTLLGAILDGATMQSGNHTSIGMLVAAGVFLIVWAGGLMVRKDKK